MLINKIKSQIEYYETGPNFNIVTVDQCFTVYTEPISIVYLLNLLSLDLRFSTFTSFIPYLKCVPKSIRPDELEEYSLNLLDIIDNKIIECLGNYKQTSDYVIKVSLANTANHLKKMSSKSVTKQLKAINWVYLVSKSEGRFDLSSEKAGIYQLITPTQDQDDIFKRSLRKYLLKLLRNRLVYSSDSKVRRFSVSSRGVLISTVETIYRCVLILNQIGWK